MDSHRVSRFVALGLVGAVLIDLYTAIALGVATAVLAAAVVRRSTDTLLVHRSARLSLPR